MVHKEHWKDEPDEHDYPAARNYLGLVTTDENAQAFATALALVPIVRRYAKDLLRASQLPGSVGQELSRGQGFTEGGQGPAALTRPARGGRFFHGHAPDHCRRVSPDLRQLPARRGCPHSVPYHPCGRSPLCHRRPREDTRRPGEGSREPEEGVNAPDRPAPYVPAPSGLDVLSSGSRPYPGI